MKKKVKKKNVITLRLIFALYFSLLSNDVRETTKIFPQENSFKIQRDRRETENERRWYGNKTPLFVSLSLVSLSRLLFFFFFENSVFNNKLRESKKLRFDFLCEKCEKIFFFCFLFEIFVCLLFFFFGSLDFSSSFVFFISLLCLGFCIIKKCDDSW